MKEVTLKVPDKQLAFFLELVEKLGFEVASELDIPERHKLEVLRRIEQSQEGDAVSWEEAKKQIKTKG